MAKFTIDLTISIMEQENLWSLHLYWITIFDRRSLGDVKSNNVAIEGKGEFNCEAERIVPNKYKRWKPVVKRS